MGSPIGYPDWQRVVSWDGESFIAEQTYVGAAAVTFGPFNVSRWAALQGYVRAGSGVFQIRFLWSLSQGFGFASGEQAFVLDGAGAQTCPFQLPNLGPWCKVIVSPLAGAGSLSIGATGTNRQVGGLYTPAAASLFDIPAQPVPAASVRTDYAQVFYAGPAHWLFTSDIALQYAVLEYCVGNALYHAFELLTPAAGVYNHLDVQVPAGQIRLRCSNTSGALASITSTMIPSRGGA